MSAHPLEEIITRLATPLAASLGLTLWGVEMGLGGRSVARVFVDAEGGVDIDRCAELSRLLGLALDVEDCMTGPYALEVSSPGLERLFFTAEQLAGAVGGQVEITLQEPPTPESSRKKFQGELTAAEDGRFTLAVADMPHKDGDAPRVVFSFDQVKKARQRLLVPEKARPGKGGAGKKHRPRTQGVPGGPIPENTRPAGAEGFYHESGTEKSH
jgi:ribosome maturation factor RimP